MVMHPKLLDGVAPRRAARPRVAVEAPPSSRRARLLRRVARPRPRLARQVPRPLAPLPLQRPPSSRASGGTLRFGTASDLLTLDGQDFSSGGEGLLGVWDRLLEQDEKLVPQPRLAESFDWSS